MHPDARHGLGLNLFSLIAVNDRLMGFVVDRELAYPWGGHWFLGLALRLELGEPSLVHLQLFLLLDTTMLGQLRRPSFLLRTLGLGIGVNAGLYPLNDLPLPMFGYQLGKMGRNVV